MWEASGQAPALCSRRRPSAGRHERLAAGELPKPARDPTGHHLRRRYFAPMATIRRRTSRSTARPPSGPTSSTARLCTSSPTPGTATGSTNTRKARTFPQNTYQSENYWVDVVFAPTGPAQPPGAVTNVTATAGALQATVNWTPPTTGGGTESYRITPYIGGTAQTPINGGRARHVEDDYRPDRRHHLHLHGHPDKRNRPRPRVRSLERGDPDDPNPPGAPTGVSATAGPLQATVNWTPPGSDGGSPNQLPRHPLCRLLAADADDRAGAGLLSHGQRPGRRDHLHLQGSRDQRGRDGPGLGRRRIRHPDHPQRARCTDGGDRRRRRAAGTVSWTAPASDGGSPITSYVVTPFIGTTAQTSTTVPAPETSTTVTGLSSGTSYTFKVAAVNVIGPGPQSAASNSVTPTNLSVDQLVTTHQASAAGSISSPAFSTQASGEMLLAFISSDGPSGEPRASRVSAAAASPGGFVAVQTPRPAPRRSGRQTPQGCSATSRSPRPDRADPTSARSRWRRSAAPIRSSTAPPPGPAPSTGAPSVSLTSTRAGSQVWGVGDDWDAAAARTVGPNQTKVDEYLAPVGDTFWVQRQTSTNALSGVQATLNDTAPTNDRWNLAAVEILPAAAQNPQPPAPTLSSTVPASPANQNSPRCSAAPPPAPRSRSTPPPTAPARRWPPAPRRTGNRDHGRRPRQLHHRPARHRDRRRQHLFLLVAAHLRGGLGRARHDDHLRAHGHDQRLDPDLRVLLERDRLELRMPLRRRRLRGLQRAGRDPHADRRRSRTANTALKCGLPTRPGTSTRARPRGRSP